MFSRTIVSELNFRLDRPWAEMRKGKAIDELWLAAQLRPFGIRSKTMWVGGTSAKGYLQSDFKEVFRRYIPKSELEALKAEVQEENEGEQGTQNEGTGESS